MTIQDSQNPVAYQAFTRAQQIVNLEYKVE